MSYSEIILCNLPTLYGEERVHHRSIFSKQQKEAAIMQVHHGISRENVLQTFQIHEKTLLKWGRDLGKPLPNDRLYTEEIRQQILNRINEGESLYAISKEVDIPAATIWKWAEADVPSQQRVQKIIRTSRRKYHFPIEIVHSAVQKVRKGITRKEVAKEYQVTPKTIQSWCEKEGLSTQFRASPQVRAAAVQRVIDGEDARVVARDYHVLECTVLQWQKQADKK